MRTAVDALAALVSEEQMRHGQNIVDVFAAGTLRHALLWADVQAGKTRTYHHVIRTMLKRRIVKRAYILCGSSEITLKKQAMADLLELNGDMTDKITVYFRSEFKKGDMDTKDALVVVDESHMDQTINQQLDKFLVRHGLCLDGTTPKMAADNTFILTVDATPYSEFAAHVHGKSKPKHIEMFEPSAAYYGIKHYMADGLINETFDFKTETGLRRMEALMERFPRKYLMFRIDSPKSKKTVNMADVLRTLCRRKRYNFLEYTEDKEEIAITNAEADEQNKLKAGGKKVQCMEDEPEKTTVILVKGRLRAGKVVPKAHVGFVWENARTAKTDSIVQGLLGRMCGYLLEDGKPNCYKLGTIKPLIFLPAAVLEKKTDTAIPLSELDRHVARDAGILPKCGTNLKKGRTTSAADNGRTQVPIMLLPRELFGEDVEHFEPAPGVKINADQLKTMSHDVFRANLDTILDSYSDLLTNEQMEEIVMRVTTMDVDDAEFDKVVKYRLLDGKKHHSGKPNSYYKQLRATHASRSAPSEHMENSPYITYSIVINPKDEIGARPGDVYVVMYTDAENPDFAAAKPTDKVAEENGKSLFSMRVRESAVAASAATLDSNATRSPADLIAAISEYIEMDRRGVYVHLEKAVVSVHEKFVFDKTVFAHSGSKDNALEKVVKPALEAKYGIHLKIIYNTGRTGPMTFAVKKISWE